MAIVPVANGESGLSVRNKINQLIAGEGVAGADEGIQFNDNGVLGSDPNFSYNKTSSTLSVPNLIVSGTTTRIDSTVVTVKDPVFTLGGDVPPVADDNLDRGIEFRYHTGAAAKLGFFGFDDSTGRWTFIPDAVNTGEVFSGAKGDLDIGKAFVTALDIIGVTPGDVGGFAAGQLQVTSSLSDPNANAVITGHNLNGGNKQLWYLGSGSSGNDNITFLNRQDADLILGTNNTTRLTIDNTGNVVLESKIQIKGGVPGVGKLLTSDATGVATWTDPIGNFSFTNPTGYGLIQHVPEAPSIRVEFGRYDTNDLAMTVDGGGFLQSSIWMRPTENNFSFNAGGLKVNATETKLQDSAGNDVFNATTSITEITGFGVNGLKLNGTVTMGILQGVDANMDIRTGKLADTTMKLRAFDVDGAVYVDFITLKANNTPTCDLSSAVTIGGSAILAANGVNFGPAAPASITVVDGQITAIS